MAERTVGPSRPLKLSHFDSRGLNTQEWKDDEERASAEGVLSNLSTAFSSIIANIGDPRPEREGLKRTPLRAAKALLYFTKGYEEDLKSMLSTRYNYSVCVSQLASFSHLICCIIKPPFSPKIYTVSSTMYEKPRFNCAYGRCRQVLHIWRAALNFSYKVRSLI